MAQQNKNEQQVDVNQLLKVRREKLADLQERILSRLQSMM